MSMDVTINTNGSGNVDPEEVARLLDRILADRLTARQAPPGGLEAVLLKALLDHRRRGDRCQCGWRPIGFDSAAHAAHVATVLTPVLAVEPCEHDDLGCGWRKPHEAHTKLGDGRPCCGWPPRCYPATSNPELAR